ncbi:hypothetical protein AG1IA_07971 [Rhizoctonia solani AG-1 IA]|uniref:Uncharacterized protein n=1 Tax=Thanatephorus cucumeris (strain AG1-IA) TaxID=983506 RepID=L8WJ89_THACA|nr:hypothetical protein AG1IA_07971 [Rhizoctonia solani AG-1 IA]
MASGRELQAHVDDSSPLHSHSVQQRPRPGSFSDIHLPQSFSHFFYLYLNYNHGNLFVLRNSQCRCWVCIDVQTHCYIPKPLHTLRHLTDVNSAPGFNNAIACMTIAVGAGSIRAGLTNSRGAMVWAVMTFASCIVNPQVASATHALTSFNHLVLSTVLLWSAGFSVSELVGLGQHTSANRSPRPRQSVGGRR